MATLKDRQQGTVHQPNDAQMIADPRNWPAWPYLPVKKPGGVHGNSIEHKTLGLLMATQEHQQGKIKIYHIYLFGLRDMTTEQIKAAPTTEYGSISAMVADGWVVD